MTDPRVATLRRGQPGVWWVINTAPKAPVPLYWTGDLYHDGRPMLSFTHLAACQFDTKESAEFQASILGLPGNWEWRAEDHEWIS